MLPTELVTGLGTGLLTGLPTQLPTGLPSGLVTRLPTGLVTGFPGRLPTRSWIDDSSTLRTLSAVCRSRWLGSELAMIPHRLVAVKPIFAVSDLHALLHTLQFALCSLQLSRVG